MPIRTRRLYALERAASRSEDDGCARYLVESTWPRGVPRDAIASSAWLRDAAPSEPLTRWFANDGARWEEFLRRYHSELDERPDAWAKIAAAAERQILDARHHALASRGRAHAFMLACLAHEPDARPASAPRSW